jgi:peroxiredoxin
VFLKSAGCAHCLEQVRAFSRKQALFRDKRIAVVFVTPDAVADLQAAAGDSPFPLLSDPDLAVARRYGCCREGPEHAVVLVDPGQLVRWRTAGPAPYMDVEDVLRRASRCSTAAR